MAHRDIVVSGKRVRPHKACISPAFNEPTVLVSSHFEYVELWLKKARDHDALSFWVQAKNLYDVAVNIPIETKPLITYYCMLNAAKALLKAKKIEYDPSHGCSGEKDGSKALLITEICTVKSKGVLPALI